MLYSSVWILHSDVLDPNGIQARKTGLSPGRLHGRHCQLHMYPASLVCVWETESSHLLEGVGSFSWMFVSFILLTSTFGRSQPTRKSTQRIHTILGNNKPESFRQPPAQRTLALTFFPCINLHNPSKRHFLFLRGYLPWFAPCSPAPIPTRVATIFLRFRLGCCSVLTFLGFWKHLTGSLEQLVLVWHLVGKEEQRGVRGSLLQRYSASVSSILTLYPTFSRHLSPSVVGLGLTPTPCTIPPSS
eukprot:XP_017449923.1 PREDICTED: uncharacterized protein LOC102557053 isoform X1 [Rattus norvegicus]